MATVSGCEGSCPIFAFKLIFAHASNRHYLDDSGNDLYQTWLEGLRDRVAKVAVIKRVARVEVGLFGDHAFVRDGISELRIDVGAGYRVYYAHVGNMVILLTSGGDKKSQSRDIERAIRLLRDWEKRNG